MHSFASIPTSGIQTWIWSRTRRLSGFVSDLQAEMLPEASLCALRNPVKHQPRQTRSPLHRHLSLDNIPHSPTSRLWNKMWDPIKWFVYQGTSRPLSALFKNSPSDPGAGYPWDGGHSQITLCRCCLYFISVRSNGVAYVSPNTRFRVLERERFKWCRSSSRVRYFEFSF